MASAVARAYNWGLGRSIQRGPGGRAPGGGQGRSLPEAEKLSICTSSRSDKFVIFSVYLQYFARASMD